MIETAVFNSRALPTHSDAPPLQEIEHEWRHGLSYGASNLDPLSLSTGLHEKEQYPTCVRDVIHPLFAPMAHQVKYGSRKGMGAEDVLHEKEQYPACVHNVAHPPTAHLVKYGGQKGMGAEEVLRHSEEPSAAIHAKDDELKDLAIHDSLVRLAFTLPSTEDCIYLVQKCREEKVLNHARQLHVHICYHGLEDYRVLGNYLVAMFVDCGNLFAAQQAFDKLVHRKEHSWTALIQGHIEGAKMQHALALYTKMQEDSVKPSKYTFLALLKACSKLKCLERGREIDYEISKNRLKEDLFVGNALVDMYAKCGSLVEARQVLDKLPVQDVVSWNALITGYAEHGLGKDALRCLDEMQLKGVPPNSVTYLCSLKACGSIGAIDRGHKVNMEVAKLGFERDLFYGNSLLDMYGKCGSLAEARKVFDELNIRDVVSWTALISGYAEHAFGEEALTCLEQMELEGVPSNSVTFVCSLKACASMGAADKGQKLHSQIVKKGLEKALCIGNTLLDMYAKCGLLFEAYLVFDTVSARDVVSWSALIAGYTEHGLHEEALYSFEQMQLEGVAPNEFSWNAVILGVSDLARSEKAVNLYLQMQEKGLLPNTITFASVLKALGSSGDIEGGRRIHAQVKRVGLETIEIVLATALVDMYGRCGGMFEAKEIFDAMCSRDLVAWSAMIMGYVRQGEIQSVFSTYEGMREECILPDEMTFLSILTMCSHAGLVDKGWAYFESLSKFSVSSLTITSIA